MPSIQGKDRAIGFSICCLKGEHHMREEKRS